MVRKMAALLAGVALILGASTAMATILDPTLVRPVTINPPAQGENSLQKELDRLFGADKVNAYNDQMKTGMFQVSTPGSDGIMPQFKFEWTANAARQGVGIYGWDAANSKAVEALMFSGANTVGDKAVVTWNTSTSGTIDVKSGGIWSSKDFSGINRNFFGFYFQPTANTNPTYFSVDALNNNGTLHSPADRARVLAYNGHAAGYQNSGIAFAYEDGYDFDYNDAGFFVESINPVPEPGTMVLLGAGFLGLAIYGKRRRNA